MGLIAQSGCVAALADARATHRYLQTNRTEPVYKEMHDKAMDGIKKHLLKVSVTKGHMYTSELMPRRDRQTGQL